MSDDLKEFHDALSRLPKPIAAFKDGAICPWCGELHVTVTFGENNCKECGKYFCFGYPEWWERKDPCSWVPFPWKEYDALGRNNALLPRWTPNRVLQQMYFQDTEQELGQWADESTAN